MHADAYRAAFRGAAMKRAKLPAMKRNAAVVLGAVGTVEDVDVLARALGDENPLAARPGPPGGRARRGRARGAARPRLLGVDTAEEDCTLQVGSGLAPGADAYG